MPSNWKLLIAILKVSGMIFVIGTLGCLVFDLLYLIFNPAFNRLRLLSAIYENKLFFIVFCFIGVNLGVLFILLVHGRDTFEK